jgi:predicted DCC family thiol-disulfide oxidoreductase YuxK
VPLELGLEADEAARDLRLLLADGPRNDGADVRRYVMRRIAWARPFHASSITPGLRWVFARAYRALADNRFRVPRAWGLAQPSARSTVWL